MELEQEICFVPRILSITLLLLKFCANYTFRGLIIPNVIQLEDSN